LILSINYLFFCEKALEKENFFRSFGDSQKELNEKKINIQKRISVLQENLQGCIQKHGEEGKTERNIVETAFSKNFGIFL